MAHEPRTLIEAIRYFADPEVALKHMVELRWPDGVYCPHCGRTDVRYIATRRIWECKEKHAKRQFSAKVGTIFEDSALPLDKWFVAIWQVANCKNGISSYEMARALGITQKSAWHMNHRIRLAMKLGTIEKMDGHIESDESYIGGKVANRHKGDPKNKRGTAGKTAVIGALQRGGNAVAEVIENTDTATLDGFVHAVVAPGAKVSTDEHSGYRHLGRTFTHGFVSHGAGEYVKGDHHTNSIEGFWALLKRSIKGTYISVEPFHLGRYVDEQVFRFNARKGKDGDRFALALSGIIGRKLTYRELTGNAAIASAA
ncbi:IS1595 family transposase [Sphingomonas sp. RT2P30]|uniref:IS1595 family transposase n=1 Tax=Parasphingomonas halimpatiens TaxID=3096162 RepID=UPI002FCA1CC5